MSKVMPKQHPGTSEQVVETPAGFIIAVLNRLHIGEFDYDLAASESNTKADHYYTEKDNSLVQNWAVNSLGWNWLNPPYSAITPWVQKCWEESRKGALVACLVPASVGSNWWAHWVDGKAYVTFLNGRITFVGHTGPYPKDLTLLLYAPYLNGGSTVWKWK